MAWLIVFAKKALCTYVQRANVSRYHLFLRIPAAVHGAFRSILLSPIRISFFYNGKSRNRLRAWLHICSAYPGKGQGFESPYLRYLSLMFISGFSHSVRKLPSAPALPDRLSADERPSLLARSAYSSFSSPFSDVSYLNEPLLVCQDESLKPFGNPVRKRFAGTVFRKPLSFSSGRGSLPSPESP